MIVLFTSILCSCTTSKFYDLIIKNAKIIDVKSGVILPNKTIIIENGLIKDITTDIANRKAKEVLDAEGKLLSPGLIDTHIHPTDVFGDYAEAPKFLPTDSLTFLRKKLSEQYLLYGTTTVMTMGQPENWLKPLLNWQLNTSNENVDFYVAGGALISKDNRTPYIAHTELTSSEIARNKILEYHQLGIKHIKLYFRLKEPEFSTIYKLADSLKIKMYGHIGDFSQEYLTMNETLKIGLINYEHFATIPNSIITSDNDWNLLNKQFTENYGELNTEARMLAFFLEQFRFISEHKQNEMQTFINYLATKKVTFSTTIHRIYEQIASTTYWKPRDKTATPKQQERSKENFGIMMKYAKQMHDKGIEIRLGSDMQNGGKVNISELIILSKYGFNASEIFKIATYNGAKALGIEGEVGSIEIGKKANLIIWDKNPFEDCKNFGEKITVFKNGNKIIPSK